MFIHKILNRYVIEFHKWKFEGAKIIHVVISYVVSSLVVSILNMSFHKNGTLEKNMDYHARSLQFEPRTPAAFVTLMEIVLVWPSF